MKSKICVHDITSNLTNDGQLKVCEKSLNIKQSYIMLLSYHFFQEKIRQIFCLEVSSPSFINRYFVCIKSFWFLRALAHSFLIFKNLPVKYIEKVFVQKSHPFTSKFWCCFCYICQLLSEYMYFFLMARNIRIIVYCLWYMQKKIFRTVDN